MTLWSISLIQSGLQLTETTIQPIWWQTPRNTSVLVSKIALDFMSSQLSPFGSEVCQPASWYFHLFPNAGKVLVCRADYRFSTLPALPI